MSALATVVLFVLGLVLLIAGAEALVRGASQAAAVLGIPSLVIGLTVVAYGTSAPELAVSTLAGLRGAGGIALGNVVGSNIFNVLFILGLSAMLRPLIVARALVRRDVPVMIGVSVAALLLALDARIGRLEGALLLAGLVVYTVWLVRAGRGEGSSGGALEAGQPQPDASERSAGFWLGRLALILGGLALLVLGSRWLVDGAVAAARALGITETVIGLTLVAAGTSLPEVATSVIATLRGERDLAVGNVVGSNVFNLLGVLGLAAFVSPGGVAVVGAMLRFDLPVMLAVAIACLPVFFTGHLIARWEGGLLFAFYLAYTLHLVLDATGHAPLPPLRAAMVFVLPLVALTLVILAVRAWRRGEATGRGPNGG